MYINSTFSFKIKIKIFLTRSRKMSIELSITLLGDKTYKTCNLLPTSVY